jgi:hypothetical protein
VNKKVDVRFPVRGTTDTHVSVLLTLDVVDSMTLTDDEIRVRALDRLKELNMHFLVEGVNGVVTP